jgi:hypothetical protein
MHGYPVQDARTNPSRRNNQEAPRPNSREYRQHRTKPWSSYNPQRTGGAVAMAVSLWVSESSRDNETVPLNRLRPSKTRSPEELVERE